MVICRSQAWGTSLRIEVPPPGLGISGSKYLPQARVSQAQSTSLRLEYLNLETPPSGSTNSLRLEYLRLEAKCTWAGVDWRRLNESPYRSDEVYPMLYIEPPGITIYAWWIS